jgi:cell surface protein SprA
MKRIYDFKYNLAKSLRFSYNANVDAYIDEPYGKITPETRDSTWNNFWKLGETKYFNQKVSLTYELPWKKFVLFDWINSQASYNGSYNWEEAPRTAKGDSLGNIIQNSQNIQINSQLNFVNLYSKINFLKTINQGKSNVTRIKKERLKKLKEEEKKKGNKDWNKLSEKDVELNEGFIKSAEALLRVMMSLRNINVNYSITNGTALPGFMKRPEYVGNDWNANAPGIGFIIGLQDDIRQKAALEGWLTGDTTLNSMYMTNHSENLIVQGTLEPLKGLRINVDMDRRLTSNHQEVYRMNSLGDFQSFSPVDNGSFTMSFYSWPTALKGKWNDKKTAAYDQFENNRFVVSQRLSTSNQIDTGSKFPMGYNRTSQQVIIPAFIAAYTDRSVSSIDLGLFPDMPGLNWRISYTALSNVDFLKDWIRNITINHAFNSAYTISSFSSSLEFDPNQKEVQGQNIIPQYRVQQISFNEQLSPLIGIDINWAKNWTTSIEYRTNRTVSFSFSNYQTAEIRGRDFTFGLGYRAKELKLPFKIKRKTTVLKHDVALRVDISIKNNISTIIKLDEGVIDQATQNVGGSKIIVIKPTIDYELSKNLKARVFFTRNVTKPVISNSYPTAFTSIGFSLIYTLGQ